MSQPIEELLQQCTVRLNLPGKYGHGTGFFVAPGLILTCAHVVKGLKEGERIAVRWQGQDNFAQADIEQTLPTFDLALLRFTPPEGIALPCVYLDESVKTGDPLYSFGYPDQDFPNGCPVTFNCEGLTGDTPPLIKFKLGQVRPGMSGAPLLNRRTGKVCGIVKFTRDRSIDLGGGAVPTSVIVTELGKLKQLQRTFHKRDRRWQQLIAAYDRLEPRLVGIASAGAIMLVLLVRFFGMLQPLELWAYDLLMSRRSPENIDKNITVIGLTGIPSSEYSIPDKQLLELLKQIDGHKPQTIGLDIYLGQKSNDCSSENCESNKSAESSLVSHLRKESKIVSICKIDTRKADPNANPQDNLNAYPPFSDINLDNLGFADAIPDIRILGGGEGVVRRQLLAISKSAIPNDSPCQTPASFNVRLALHYLEKKFGILPSEEDPFQIGDVNLADFFLRTQAGGYNRSENNSINDGFQLLLNYRHPPGIGETSFKVIEYDINNSEKALEQLNSANIKGKIIIVGYLVIDSDDNPDYAPTPFGYGNLGYKLVGNTNDRRIPGSFIQAHMVSQLVNAVKGDRHLIWFWPEWIEIIWIIGWGTIAGIILWRFRGIHLVVISLGTAVVIITASYFVLFRLGGWLPLVPAVLGVLLITRTVNPSLSLLKQYSPKLIRPD